MLPRQSPAVEAREVQLPPLSTGTFLPHRFRDTLPPLCRPISKEKYTVDSPVNAAMVNLPRDQHENECDVRR